MCTQITRIFKQIGIVFGLVLMLTGCDGDGFKSASEPGNLRFSDFKNIDSGVTVQPDSAVLYAGQTIPVGTVTVEVVSDDSGAYALRVVYQTVNSWELTEVHLWVGTDLGDMPQTRQGNPKIGRFPYKNENMAGMTSYEFFVPISLSDSVCDTAPDYFVVAHAVVRQSGTGGAQQTETAWAGNETLAAQGSWATYFSIDILCDDVETPDTGGNGSETAFAFGGGAATCFLELDFNRWGWTNGPLSQGSYEFPVYAGAGQCDLEKGTQVGTLHVNYVNTTATVRYHMNSDDYTLQETHLYLGAEMLARDVNGSFTVAPGQYPYKHEELNDITSDEYTVNTSGGAIYIVAHATVTMP